MKARLFNFIRFCLESIGVAGAIYVLLTTVAISRDNQDSLNEVADKLNSMDQQVKVNAKAIKSTKIVIQKVIVHERHTNIFGVEQWVAGKLKK